MLASGGGGRVCVRFLLTRYRRPPVFGGGAAGRDTPCGFLLRLRGVVSSIPSEH